MKMKTMLLGFWKNTKNFSPVDLSNAPVKIDTQTKGYMQLLPGIHPCDGFFISVLKILIEG